MAMPTQESAPAVRNGPAKPSAAVRTPRPDAIPAAFPGLLAVALAQSLPPNLLSQGSGGNSVAATAGWMTAARPSVLAAPPTGWNQTSDGVATAATPPFPTSAAVPPAQQPAMSSDVPSAPATVAVGSAKIGAFATGAATAQPNLPGQADVDGSAMAAAAIAAGPQALATPPTGRNQSSGGEATMATSAPQILAAAAPAQLATQAAPPAAPETAAVGSANSGTCATGAATPQPNLLGQAGGDRSAMAAAGWMTAAGPPVLATPPTGWNQTSDSVTTAVTPPFQASAAVPQAQQPAMLSNEFSAPAAVTVGSANIGACATGAATTQPNLLGQAGGDGSALAAPATAAGPPALTTAAAVSPDSDTYSPGSAAPPPATATPRQGLAEVWQAANLGVAASLAPTGQNFAFPPPGSMSTGTAVPDAAGTGVQPGAAGALPATVSRQVTIQLLKHSGDATAPGGRLTLRLDPPQLGRVEVSFEPQGNRLLVTLTAQTPEAERALRSGAGELQHALAGAGGKWHDVQVKIEPASGRDEAPQDSNDGEDPGEQPSRRRQTRDDD